MTRRGQNPYSSNSSSGFSQQQSYTPVPASTYEQPRYDAAPSAAPKFKTKGMQLGAKGRKNDTGLAEALGGLNVDDEPVFAHRQQEEERIVTPVAPPAPSKNVNPFGEVDESEYVLFSIALLIPLTEFAPHSVNLVIRETLSLALNRDGGLNSISLKGDLDLRITDPSKAVVVISLPPPSSYSGAVGNNDLQFKTHPNVDKKAWAEKGEIRLKEGKKGFPVGQGLGVLKWRMTGKDESGVPVSSAFHSFTHLTAASR